MNPDDYDRDFRWFFRATAILTVIGIAAIAVLIGLVIWVSIQVLQHFGII